jgi:hypothetical protein
MKTFQIIIAVLLLPILVSVHAADSWQKDGMPAANTASMKSKGGFGAQLFLTQDTGVFQKWNTPEPPRIAPVTKARRDLPILTVLLFAGPGTDSSGHTDVTCDFIAYKPDGSVYGKQLNAVVWKRGYPANAGIQLSEGYMGIRIEPKDPVGAYTVEARVHDHIKKLDLVLKTTFQVPR